MVVRSLSRVLRIAAKIAVLAAALAVVAVASWAYLVWPTLPSNPQLKLLMASSQVLIDEAGNADGSRRVVCHCPIFLKPEEVPERLAVAVRSIEDRTFDTNWGLIRSGWYAGSRSRWSEGRTSGVARSLSNSPRTSSSVPTHAG